MVQQETSQTKAQTKVVIRNIGLLLSGDLNKPILDADTLLAVNGKIAAVGKSQDVDQDGATTIIAKLNGLDSIWVRWPSGTSTTVPVSPAQTEITLRAPR